jgi:hypothetical protein
MVFVEDPWSRIVAVHWADDGPTDPGGDGTHQCGSGWFPLGGWFPGGDGFPPQPISGTANMLVEHGGVHWNPAVAQPPPVDNPYLFFIPGLGASHLTIRIAWRGVLPPEHEGILPLLAGLWIFPGRAPYPPYNNAAGTPVPVLQRPPFSPTVSAQVIGDGSVAFDGPEIQIGKFDVPCTVAADYAAYTLSGVAMAPRPSVPFIPSTRAGPPHFGFPGDHPGDGIWISVEYVCPDAVALRAVG